MRNSFRYLIGAAIAVALGGVVLAQTSFMRVLAGNTTNPALADIGNSGGGVYFGSGFTGQIGHEAFGLGAGAATPTLSACGTTPALQAGATDNGGTITTGTTATGCTITFGTAWTATPSCSVSWQSNLASMSYVVSTTTITVTQTSTSNNKISWQCQGGPNG